MYAPHATTHTGPWYHVNYLYWVAGGRQRETWQEVQAPNATSAIHAAKRNHPAMDAGTAYVVACETPNA